jgi:hypothetical protein
MRAGPVTVEEFILLGETKAVSRTRVDVAPQGWRVVENLTRSLEERCDGANRSGLQFKRDVGLRLGRTFGNDCGGIGERHFLCVLNHALRGLTGRDEIANGQLTRRRHDNARNAQNTDERVRRRGVRANSGGHVHDVLAVHRNANVSLAIERLERVALDEDLAEGLLRRRLLLLTTLGHGLLDFGNAVDRLAVLLDEFAVLFGELAVLRERVVDLLLGVAGRVAEVFHFLLKSIALLVDFGGRLFEISRQLDEVLNILVLHLCSHLV